MKTSSEWLYCTYDGKKRLRQKHVKAWYRDQLAAGMDDVRLQASMAGQRSVAAAGVTTERVVRPHEPKVDANDAEEHEVVVDAEEEDDDGKGLVVRAQHLETSLGMPDTANDRSSCAIACTEGRDESCNDSDDWQSCRPSSPSRQRVAHARQTYARRSAHGYRRLFPRPPVCPTAICPAPRIHTQAACRVRMAPNAVSR